MMMEMKMAMLNGEWTCQRMSSKQRRRQTGQGGDVGVAAGSSSMS